MEVVEVVVEVVVEGEILPPSCSRLRSATG